MNLGLVVWLASCCGATAASQYGVYYGIQQRRLSGGGAVKATGAELLFLRGCEGEAANMQAGTGAGKVRGIATPAVEVQVKLLRAFAVNRGAPNAARRSGPVAQRTADLADSLHFHHTTTTDAGDNNRQRQFPAQVHRLADSLRRYRSLPEPGQIHHFRRPPPV